MPGIAEGKNALLGAGFFLVAAGAPESRIEAVLVEGLFQAIGFMIWVCSAEP